MPYFSSLVRFAAGANLIVVHACAIKALSCTAYASVQ